MIEHAQEIIAVLAPTVNSYKRLIPGFEAPNLVAWDYSNRSAMIRIPGYNELSPAKTRIEIRCPDTSANPYLAFAVLLNAGLDGVERNLEPPANIDLDLYKLTPAEIKSYKIRELPHNLEEALDFMEKSRLVKATLGDHLFTSFLELKREEYAAYRELNPKADAHQITDWEIDRYLRRS